MCFTLSLNAKRMESYPAPASAAGAAASGTVAGCDIGTGGGGYRKMIK